MAYVINRVRIIEAAGNRETVIAQIADKNAPAGTGIVKRSDIARPQ